MVGLTEKKNAALDRYLTYRRDHNSRFSDGQISSELRSAGLKLVANGLRKRLFEIFTDNRLKEDLKNQVGVGPYRKFLSMMMNGSAFSRTNRVIFYALYHPVFPMLLLLWKIGWLPWRLITLWPVIQDL